jgi:hypothetical protein
MSGRKRVKNGPAGQVTVGDVLRGCSVCAVTPFLSLSLIVLVRGPGSRTSKFGDCDCSHLRAAGRYPDSGTVARAWAEQGVVPPQQKLVPLFFLDVCFETLRPRLLVNGLVLVPSPSSFFLLLLILFFSLTPCLLTDTWVVVQQTKFREYSLTPARSQELQLGIQITYHTVVLTGNCGEMRGISSPLRVYAYLHRMYVHTIMGPWRQVQYRTGRRL